MGNTISGGLTLRQGKVEVFLFNHLAKVDEPIVVSADAVNKEVNQMIETYRGRNPIEIACRIYLSYRGSNKVITRGESQVYLEMVFRASVLTGTVKPTEDELLKLSAFVDAAKKNSDKTEQGKR